MNEHSTPDAAEDSVSSTRRPRSNLTLVIGLVLLGSMVVVAIVAPFFLGDTAEELTDASGAGSSSAHLLGTDTLGRDMLARTLVAARPTLLMALAATAIAAVVGLAVGIGAWLAPRKVRELVLRTIELVVCYPTLLVAIMVAAILGQGGVTSVIAIGIANIAAFARMSANLAAGLSQRDFVMTAKLAGVPAPRIAVRHILPNMSEAILILIAQTFAAALMEISALSFVGLGSQSPAFDYGTLLNDALPRLMMNPIMLVGPAAGLIIVALGALLIGDGLAARANPRTQTTRSRLLRRPGVSVAADKAVTAPLVVADSITVVASATGRELVSDVSLHINHGEIVGIVGESGSGKSLTAATIARLVPEGLTVTASQLTVDGVDFLEHVDDQTLVEKISLVYQDPGAALNPALQVGSQFSDVLTAHCGLSRSEAKERILTGFADVKLVDPERQYGQYPHEMSGGMRQRAMIASAMTTGGRLLIADEPTTALDVTVQREVLTVIKRLNREEGTAVLFISHDLAVVRELCDRVIVMRHGQIVDRIDDAADLTLDRATGEYTRALLAAAPTVVLEDQALSDGTASSEKELADVGVPGSIGKGEIR